MKSAGPAAAADAAGRDFTGTTSTSASDRSLCKTFTASRENSGCTAPTIGSDAGCGARNGFSLSAQPALRAGLAAADLAAAGTGAAGVKIFTGTGAALAATGV